MVSGILFGITLMNNFFHHHSYPYFSLKSAFLSYSQRQFESKNLSKMNPVIFFPYSNNPNIIQALRFLRHIMTNLAYFLKSKNHSKKVPVMTYITFTRVTSFISIPSEILILSYSNIYILRS